jgi:DNA mismatch repair protein MutS
MNEAANILNNATPRSLVLLDEIGRGTSTFDGLSIAWAMTEYLHNGSGIRPRTLFATHYHELTDLERLLPRVRNYSVSVRKSGDDIVFLHRLVPGGCDHSYGIEVAKMAGMPPDLVARAREVLRLLERNELTLTRWAVNRSRGGDNPLVRDQMTLFGQVPDREPEDHPVLKELRELDVGRTTPMDALAKLDAWRRRIDEEDAEA